MTPSIVDYTMRTLNFNENKKILKKIESQFVSQDGTVEDIICDYAQIESQNRDNLIADIDMFDNSTTSSYGKGKDDIMALCIAIETTYQPAHCRHFGSDYLEKVRQIKKSNDKSALFGLFLSINRAAKANLKISVHTATSLDLEIENISQKFFENLRFNDQMIMTKAGNRHKKRKKSLKKDKDCGSLFDAFDC